MIANNLQRYKLCKKIILQIVIKVINNIIGLYGLILTFLVFKIYLCILKFNIFILIII